MADDQEPPLDDDDLGAPVAELRDFEEAPASGFLDRVVRRLRRRALGGQLMTLAWTGFGQVVLEFLRIVYSFFEPRRPDRGE